MRIPVTMCHGVGGPLTAERFAALVSIARELGFTSITYDELDGWLNRAEELPDRPIMLDFDHPEKSIYDDIRPILADLGYHGSLFINTGAIERMHQAPLPSPDRRELMTWDEVGELVETGWLIGSHTVTHPNLSDLSMRDPSGQRLRKELEDCDETIRFRVGVESKDFAFTGTSWSSVAEQEVMKRYRFGRLWIVGSIYKADGRTIRYADLVGVEGQDEIDGGPPMAARYITRSSHHYRLPSMELTRLVLEPEAFRRYLMGAVAD